MKEKNTFRNTNTYVIWGVTKSQMSLVRRISATFHFPCMYTYLYESNMSLSYIKNAAYNTSLVITLALASSNRRLNKGSKLTRLCFRKWESIRWYPISVSHRQLHVHTGGHVHTNLRLIYLLDKSWSFINDNQTSVHGNWIDHG